MNYFKFEDRLKRAEIFIAMKQSVSFQQAKRGNPAVDSLSNCVTLRCQLAIIRGSGDRHVLAAAIKNVELQQLSLDGLKLSVAADPLQNLTENQVDKTDRLSADALFQPESFGVTRSPEVVHPNRGVNDDHIDPSRPTVEQNARLRTRPLKVIARTSFAVTLPDSRPTLFF